jgi:hypothetical protein
VIPRARAASSARVRPARAVPADGAGRAGGRHGARCGGGLARACGTLAGRNTLRGILGAGVRTGLAVRADAIGGGRSRGPDVGTGLAGRPGSARRRVRGRAELTARAGCATAIFRARRRYRDELPGRARMVSGARRGILSRAERPRRAVRARTVLGRATVQAHELPGSATAPRGTSRGVVGRAERAGGARAADAIGDRGAPHAGELTRAADDPRDARARRIVIVIPGTAPACLGGSICTSAILPGAARRASCGHSRSPGGNLLGAGGTRALRHALSGVDRRRIGTRRARRADLIGAGAAGRRDVRSHLADHPRNARRRVGGRRELSRRARCAHTIGVRRSGGAHVGARLARAERHALSRVARRAVSPRRARLARAIAGASAGHCDVLA